MSHFDEFTNWLNEKKISVTSWLRYIEYGEADFEMVDEEGDDLDYEQADKIVREFCKTNNVKEIKVGSHYDGKEYDIIFSYKDIFIRGEAYYSSWDSASYQDELKQVEKKEKTIIVYE